ncbi:type I restriction-modification enzyme R subunit C-terminal domain-containing protein [Ponticoccus alexandrii]|uniref:type I restriction-modification enzyme R subunit C-terminal domain-containing protein n=1 Tax=Ponticoccus alexandrii TaxID=1943633 RepID=UPI0026C5C962
MRHRLPPDAGRYHFRVDKARSKMKVRRFIDGHGDHITLITIRRGEALTKQDLEELLRILIEQEIADGTLIADLQDEGCLGGFLRSLTGLDKAAAKEAFSAFVTVHQLDADQPAPPRHPHGELVFF